MNDKERDLVKKYDIHGIAEHFRQHITPEEYNLDTCYNNVVMLLDFMEVIEKNASQLTNPVSLKLREKGFTSAPLLFGYIILEISNFYTNIHHMQKKGKSLPSVPTYWKELKDFRDAVPAHQDKEHKLKTLADHILVIREIKSIGPIKIVEDFLAYYKNMKETAKGQSASSLKDH